MGSVLSYRAEGPVATVTMDDGKVNVLSAVMIGELSAAIDRAAREGLVVVLSGRQGVFSAGFDLAVLRAGGRAALDMMQAGFKLAERLLELPVPVVMACTGHAIAMGAFLLLSGDYRVGAAGDFKITANEVAIGITLPMAAVEICRHRLSPAAFSRAAIMAEVFGPQDAVQAGFLDRVVAPGELGDAARAVAGQLANLDLAAHAATKRRARHQLLQALHEAIDADAADYLEREPAH
jgi:enoyl-CoA hydratase